MREHLAAYEKQTGSIHPSLIDAPTLPPGCSTLWSDFVHLHRRRGSDGMGPSMITDMQIEAFERVQRVTLQPWQIEAIIAADDAFFEVSGE